MRGAEDYAISTLREELVTELCQDSCNKQNEMMLRAIESERNLAQRNEASLEKRLRAMQNIMKNRDESNAQLRKKNNDLLLALENMRMLYARQLQKKKKQSFIVPHQTSTPIDVIDLVEVENRMDRAIQLERERTRQASTSARMMGALCLFVALKKNLKGQAFRLWSSLTLNTAVRRFIGLCQRRMASRACIIILKGAIHRLICRAFRIWHSKYIVALQNGNNTTVSKHNKSCGTAESVHICERHTQTLKENSPIASTQTPIIQRPRMRTQHTQSASAILKSDRTQTELSSIDIDSRIQSLEGALLEEKIEKTTLENKCDKLQQDLCSLQKIHNQYCVETERKWNEKLAIETQRSFEIEKRCSELETDLLVARSRSGDANLRSMRLAARAARAETTLKRERATTAEQMTTFEIKAALAQDRAAARHAECNANLHEKMIEMKQLEQNLKTKIDTVQTAEAINSAAFAMIIARDTVIEQKIQELATKTNTKTVNAPIEDLEKQHRLEARIKELEQNLILADMTRRRMHNALQEARGNIRVIARVRGGEPQANTSLKTLSTQPDRVFVHTPTEMSIDGITMKKRQKPQHYCFDRAFGPSSTQSQVFEEVHDLILSSVDGYHVSILTYGSTGSGKTYTMYEDGIIPRAAQTLCVTINNLKVQGWKFALDASCVEVYEEKIFDLLPRNEQDRVPVELRENCGQNTYSSKYPQAEFLKNKEVSRKLETLMIQQEGPDLDGVTRWPIDLEDCNAIANLVDRAARSRTTRATCLNHRSSRSHSVFVIRVVGYNEAMRTATLGSLTLVDLAGSERCAISGAMSKPEQMRETCSINRSLSCLVSVFSALRLKYASSASTAKKYQQSIHVPYRDSKLTHLLQNALSGEGKDFVLHYHKTNFVKVYQHYALRPNSLRLLQIEPLQKTLFLCLDDSISSIPQDYETLLNS